jgi:peptidyl-prolyl cis-trans isomerase A (cyclophilin A)
MKRRFWLQLVSVGVAFITAGCQAADPQGPAQPGAGQPPLTLKPKVRVDTSLGDFVIELDAEKAPVTVLNFLQYVESGFYKNTIFHRVIKDYLIQAGGYGPKMDLKTKGVRDPILLESDNNLSNVRGAVAMSRKLGPNSATTEFFINLTSNAEKLDRPQPDGHGYAVFAQVVEGMSVVDQIARVPVGPHEKYAAGRLPFVPNEPVVIESMRLVRRFDRAKAKALADKRQAEFDRKQEEARRTTEEWMAIRTQQIKKEANTELSKSRSGLLFVDRRLGSGQVPTINDEVVFLHRASLLNGTEFETTYGEEPPPVYEVGRLIPGLQETVTTMHVGGLRTVIIPPELAYGEVGAPGLIPPNATLVYEIELLEIK